MLAAGVDAKVISETLGHSQMATTGRASEEVVMLTEDDQAANTWESSANALNSRALRAGSSRNIVHCSPVSPAKRT